LRGLRGQSAPCQFHDVYNCGGQRDGQSIFSESFSFTIAAYAARHIYSVLRFPQSVVCTASNIGLPSLKIRFPFSSSLQTRLGLLPQVPHRIEGANWTQNMEVPVLNPSLFFWRVYRKIGNHSFGYELLTDKPTLAKEKLSSTVNSFFKAMSKL
jgi:hypothetical protein